MKKPGTWTVESQWLENAVKRHQSSGVLFAFLLNRSRQPFTIHRANGKKSSPPCSLGSRAKDDRQRKHQNRFNLRIFGSGDYAKFFAVAKHIAHNSSLSLAPALEVDSSSKLSQSRSECGCADLRTD
jgi:hypothetical protein